MYVLRTLFHKRFWCYISGICWFLGHNPSGYTVPKSLLQHGRYVSCFHYYCRRCQSAEPSYDGSLDNGWWRRNVLYRALWGPLIMKIIRTLNRNEFFPEKTDTAFQSFLRRAYTWYSRKAFERWQKKEIIRLRMRRRAWDNGN